MSGGPRRRWRVPEVVQTSAMDCGPASLAALLAGLEVQVDFAKLREVCQTDVDGTSIDTMEEVAVALGLEAEQIMLPIDHLLLPEARALPAIVVIRLPDGATHFVVVWRKLGPFVQVMDPGQGRYRIRARELERLLYVHRQPVDPDAWREWFVGAASLDVQRARLRALGISNDARERWIATVVGDERWRSAARLDAALRMTAELIDARAIARGAEAERMLAALAESSHTRAGAGGARADDDDDETIPRRFWSLRERDAAHAMHGVVLVRVSGRTAGGGGARATAEAPDQERAERREGAADVVAPPHGAARALEGLTDRGGGLGAPARELWRLLRAERWPALGAMAAFAIVSGGALLLEALVLRGLLGLVGELPSSRERVFALGVTVALLAALLALDVSIRGVLFGAGRRLEMRLRMAFLAGLPRIKERYFRTRLTSDLAMRAHSVHLVRLLPEHLGEVVHAGAEIVILTAALVWLAPAHAWLALLAGAAALGAPLLAQGWLREADLRAQTHAGALSRFYLDAFLGAAPARAHVAERSLARAHDALLVDWAAANRRIVAAQVAVEAALWIGAGIPAAALVTVSLLEAPSTGATLLLVFWALALPARAAAAASLLARVPSMRNTALRLAEPLASVGEGDAGDAGGERERGSGRARSIASPAAAPATTPDAPDAAPPARGVSVELRGVGVEIGGRALLEDVALSIAPGEHVAVVGASGAGKSTLIALLLGLREATRGEVRVEGDALRGEHLAWLRARTAWIRSRGAPLEHEHARQRALRRAARARARGARGRRGGGARRGARVAPRGPAHAARRERALALRRAGPARSDRARAHARRAGARAARRGVPGPRSRRAGAHARARTRALA